MNHPVTNKANPAPAKRATASRTNFTTSAELMGSVKELVILHADAEYLLRVTSNGKLILTK